MRVAVLYECSGTVRNAFAAAGHDAVSVDLLPSMTPGQHWQGDVWDFLRRFPAHIFDLIVAHPECTYVTISGIHRNVGNPERQAKTEAAVENFRKLLHLDTQIICENPKSILSTVLWKPRQTVQPYDYGHDASKTTMFWPGVDTDYVRLKPTVRVPGRWVRDPLTHRMMERWSNQTDSGNNCLPERESRWLERSMTYPGIAAAMAYHWGDGSLRGCLRYLEYQMEALTERLAA